MYGEVSDNVRSATILSSSSSAIELLLLLLLLLLLPVLWPPPSVLSLLVPLALPPAAGDVVVLPATATRPMLSPSRGRDRLRLRLLLLLLVGTKAMDAIVSAASWPLGALAFRASMVVVAGAAAIASSRPPWLRLSLSALSLLPMVVAVTSCSCSPPPSRCVITKALASSSARVNAAVSAASAASTAARAASARSRSGNRRIASSSPPPPARLAPPPALLAPSLPSVSVQSCTETDGMHTGLLVLLPPTPPLPRILGPFSLSDVLLFLDLFLFFLAFFSFLLFFVPVCSFLLAFVTVSTSLPFFSSFFLFSGFVSSRSDLLV